MSNFRNAHAVTGTFQSEPAATAAIFEKEVISCPRNVTDISLEKPDNSYSKFTTEELVRAVELLVSPDELCERDVLIAILSALELRPQDVVDQLRQGVPLNAGPVLKLSCYDFNTTKRNSVA